MVVDEYGNRRFFGTYRSLVVDNADPLAKGRLKLRIPQVLFDQITEWCWGKGTPGIPAIGSGVWVTFEGGDPSFPVWGGTFGDTAIELNATLPATYNPDTATIGVNQDAFTHLSGTATTGLEYVTLDATNPNGSTALGMLAWSPIDSTPEVRVGDGTVNLQIGQEEHTRVANNTGIDIPNGVVVALIGGASGGGPITSDHPFVAPYVADGTISPFRVVGVTTQVIPNGGDGLVTTRGKIHQLDTSAYVAGDVLYGNPDVAKPGTFTTVLPSPPNDIVALGTVVTSSTTAGVLLVSVTPLINQLQTNILVFPTTTVDGTGYKQAVTSILDSRFNTTAVNILTPSITGNNIYCGGVISDANIFVGNPGVVTMTVAGAIQRVSGNNSSSATFYFNVYKRTSLGVETLLGTSSGAPVSVTSTTYTQYLATALVTFTSFINTDRLVIKFYGNNTGNQTPTFNFQYGGAAPVRALIPAPVVTVSTPPATAVSADTTNFNNNLTSADNTVQKALDTLDSVLVVKTTDTGTVTGTMILNGTVTYTDIQNVSATNKFLGRISTGAGSTEELTAVNAVTIINSQTTSAIAATAGGTGKVSYNVGDLLIGAAGNTLTSYATTTAGKVLISGTTPAWGQVQLSSGASQHVTGTLPVGNGGTNITTYAVGDLLVGGASNTLTKYGAVVAGSALISQGSGTAAAPVWGQIGLTTHVSGTLAVGNGGTGAPSFSNVNGYIKAGSTITSPLVSQAGIPIADVSGSLPLAQGGTGVTTGAGLIAIIPTSVTVGSGTSSTNARGQVTFTGANNIIINGVFTATYDNYLVKVSTAHTAGDYLYFRFSVGGTANSGANYTSTMINGQSGTVAGASATNASYAQIGYAPLTNRTGNYDLQVYNPFRTDITTVNTVGGYAATLYTTRTQFNTTTSMDGIQFGPINSGSLTGTVVVYGYQQ